MGTSQFTPEELQALLRQQRGLRIGPEMATYLIGRLAAGDAAAPVIATDARTGVAIRTQLDLADLAALVAAAPPTPSSPQP